MRVKHLFIINPTAGRGETQKTLPERIRAAAEALGAAAEIYETKAAGDDGGDFIRSRAAEGEALRVYACGGDGTLNDVINGAADLPELSVGVLPCGSGNDFAKMMPAPEKCGDPAELMRAPARECDLMEVNGRRCCNMTNLGFDALVAHRMLLFKRLPLVSGPMAYSMAVVAGLFSRMSYRMKARFDSGEELEGPYMLCAVGNGAVCGGGFRALPRADIRDGKMDCCFVRQVSRFAFPALIGSYAKGTHLDDPRLAKICFYRQCRELTVETDRQASLAVDGEDNRGRRFVYRILPGAARVVMPE